MAAIISCTRCSTISSSFRSKQINKAPSSEGAFCGFNLWLSEKSLFGCVIFSPINLCAIHFWENKWYIEATKRKEQTEMTLGKRIAMLRRQKGLKQEDLANTVGVSSQAVSKWENDQTCPDISLLPKLAELLGVTVDELLSGEKKELAQTAKVLPPEERKDLKDMMLRIVVDSADGGKVRVNIPMALVQVALDMGMEMPQVSGNAALKNIDLAQILELVRQGAIGNLVEVESSDGDVVRIYVE